MIQENNKRINKLAIDEAQERLDKFFEILLRADLRTLERLQSKKENEKMRTNCLTMPDNGLKYEP
jgi:hypothetical protein